MSNFINTITAFPTVIFTFFLVLLSLYWLLVIIGALDLGIVDIGLDIDDIDPESSVGGLSGLLISWGLSGVPITVVASLMTSLGWLMTSVVTAVIFPHINSPQVRFIAGLGLLGIVFIITIPITARLIRPLRKIFRTRQAVGKSTFVGQNCIVKTLKVTDAFGQGEVADGEAGILVDIIASVPNDIKQGDSVILVEYDENADIYYVSKL